jgi:hypothetical protein
MFGDDGNASTQTTACKAETVQSDRENVTTRLFF